VVCGVVAIGPAGEFLLIEHQRTGAVRKNDLRQRRVRKGLVVEIRVEAAQIGVRGQGSLALGDTVTCVILGGGEDVQLVTRMSPGGGNARGIVVSLAALPVVGVEAQSI